MPRSRRNKIVSLTQTEGKGRDLKVRMIESLREHVDNYDRIFVFSFDNLKASRFKDIRMDFRESKISLGKVSIAQIALGRRPEDEYKDNLHHVSEALVAQTGLLFTSRSKKEVLKYFQNVSYPEYANAGFVPKEDITIAAGLLNDYKRMTGSMSDHLRKLGMVVEIVNGELDLKNDFVVATAGVPLTPEQAKVLEHMEMPLAQFKVSLVGHWNKKKSSYEEL